MRWSRGLGSGRSASSVRPILKEKKRIKKQRKQKRNKNEMNPP